MSTSKLRQILLACGVLLSGFCFLALGQGGTGKLPPIRNPINRPPIRNPPPRNPPPRVPDLRISERRVRDIVILDLAGRITGSEGGDVLRNAIRRLVRDGKKKILLNLAKVSSIDASEAEELVSIYVSVEKDGGQLKLCRPTTKVREQLTRKVQEGPGVDFARSGLIFDMFEKEQDALDSFR